MFGDDILFMQRFLKSVGLYAGRLDGLYGELSDTALQRFEEITDAIAAESGRFDARSERNIGTLHPAAQRLARRFLRGASALDALMRARVHPKIISGTRTYVEQAAIFAQGRTSPGRIVTNAGPGRSNHNFGIAWDVGLFQGPTYLLESELYDVVGRFGRQIGLEWGGDWSSFIDKPHFQLRMGWSLAEVKNRFESGVAYA